ncbi:cardiolipin synthase [Trinickia dabaoshanensis]|uniref:phospholipase D n=1 Tax=Trinickia dabaoshanensis TaxID=564714 RepID=A0A2N7VL33_9BURK|nr:phospholipase D-like domain-containing protein [Trinickia dabaoshanensis]PMS17859.1 cardiolipin synthase [Trinickia dabaoshanensis]
MKRIILKALLGACALTVYANVAGAAATAAPTLITEPDQGLAPVYTLMQSATSTLDMTMYELVDTQAEDILVQLAAKGVAVRVILDQNLESRNNQSAYDYLSQNGVNVVWANPAYSATHEKAIVVDGQTAAVMTLNLTSRYYATSRDFAVIDHDANDVAAIETTFNADFANDAVTPPTGDDLVWSPTNSTAALLSVIHSATSTLQIENEEMGNSMIVTALVNAAHRGVQVQVTMTYNSKYVSNYDKLSAAGVLIATYDPNASLYIHAKAIVADYGTSSAEAFVGSENFSVASLTRNRELGLVTQDPSVIASLASVLQSDFRGGTLYGSGAGSTQSPFL